MHEMSASTRSTRPLDSPERLAFSDPPVTLATGTRGPVLLGKFEDSHVAVKVIHTRTPKQMRRSPPSGASDGGASSSTSEPGCTPPLPWLRGAACSELAQAAARSQPAAVQHPRLVRVLHVEEEMERTLEVRELCDGGELFDEIAENGPMRAERALELASKLAAVLAHCHASGVACGQFRAEHILLHQDELKVLGFGGQHGPDKSPRELDAPEMQGLERASVAELAPAELAPADVWALGVLLVCMLAGRPPFERGVHGSIGAQIDELEQRGLTNARPDLAASIPTRAIWIIEGMLRRSAQRRPTSSQALGSLKSMLQAFESPQTAAGVIAAHLHAAVLVSPNSSSSDEQAVSPLFSPTCGSPIGPSARSPFGYVRCAGWESLPKDAPSLVDAVVRTLELLRASYTFESTTYRFQVTQNKPHMPPLAPYDDGQGAESEKMPSPPLTPPLVLSITIFRADAKGLANHVDVRRLQGVVAHFGAWYSRFGSHFAAQLGMQNYSQLSCFSPLQAQRRPASLAAPAAGFSSRAPLRSCAPTAAEAPGRLCALSRRSAAPVGPLPPG